MQMLRELRIVFVFVFVLCLGFCGTPLMPIIIFSSSSSGSIVQVPLQESLPSVFSAEVGQGQAGEDATFDRRAPGGFREKQSTEGG